RARLSISKRFGSDRLLHHHRLIQLERDASAVRNAAIVLARSACDNRASCSTGRSADHRRLRLVTEDLTCDSTDDRTRRHLLRVVAGVAVANLLDLR